MRLPRIGDKPEDRLLEEAASVALISGHKVVNLSGLKSAKGLAVKEAGSELQKRGFGQLIEASENGHWEYHFGVNGRGFDYAAEVRNYLASRTILGRLRRINWNAVNAVAAVIAAVAAMMAAYFSYLALVNK